MKKILPLILAAVLLLTLLSGCSEKSKGYETPEAVVEAFMEAFKNQDVEAMLACCYTEPFLENASFADYIDQQKAATISQRVAPMEYPFHRELVGYRLEGDFAMRIQCMAYSVACEDTYADFTSGVPITADGDWAEEFSEDVDPANLETLEMIEMLDPLENEDKNTKKRFAESVEDLYGADDAAERLAVFEVDGEMYWKGFTLVEYEGLWYIRGLSSLFAGDEPGGGATYLEDKAALKDLRNQYS